MKQRWKVWLVVLAVLLVTAAAAVPIGIHFMELIQAAAVFGPMQTENFVPIL